MPADAFASDEVATFWPYLESSLDSFIELAQAIEPEALHWKPPAPEANSIAVLITHTFGNVRENVFEILGGEPVNRQREEEFIDRPVTAETLTADWHALKPRLKRALSTVPASEMGRVRNHPRRGDIIGREVLIVATRHAAEHLGQAELTRDLWAASRG